MLSGLVWNIASFLLTQLSSSTSHRDCSDKSENFIFIINNIYLNIMIKIKFSDLSEQSRWLVDEESWVKRNEAIFQTSPDNIIQSCHEG
jgi:hypothetical protein